MTKKKELLVDILDQLTEIKDVLDQVLNNLIPQPKEEGPELLNEEVPTTRVIADFDDAEENDRLVTDQDGWSNK